MKLFLKLIFSLFIFATAEIFVATSSSGESSGSQGDHEREHQLHRSQHVKRTLRTTSATEVPLFYSPPEIEKRYECIPYQDYVVRNITKMSAIIWWNFGFQSILDLKFENFTMEKLSVENYQLNCEKIDQHNVLYQKLIFTYAKGKNHLIWKEFEESR